MWSGVAWCGFGCSSGARSELRRGGVGSARTKGGTALEYPPEALSMFDNDNDNDTDNDNDNHNGAIIDRQAHNRWNACLELIMRMQMITIIVIQN